MVRKFCFGFYVVKYNFKGEWRFFFCFSMGYRMNWNIVRVLEDIVWFGFIEGFSVRSKSYGSGII